MTTKNSTEKNHIFCTECKNNFQKFYQIDNNLKIKIGRKFKKRNKKFNCEMSEKF